MDTQKTTYEVHPAEQLNTNQPESGIYSNVPDSLYFDVKALNSSRISKLFKESPAHVKYEIENPDRTPTDSQILGTTAHITLLQPDLLDKRVKTLPEGYAGSNAWKEALVMSFPDAPLSKDNSKADNLALIAEHYPDTLVTDHEKLGQAKQMVERMKADDKQYFGGKLASVMQKGEAEVVFIWEDEKTGVLCKCKFDWINFDYGLGFDYKSTRNANPDKFKYSISDYGYHRQLVHYYMGANANGVDLKKNAIVAQESEPPYVHCWYEFMFEADYGAGARGTEFQVASYQVEQALSLWQYCTENDYWPGYTNGFKGDNVFPIALKYDEYRQYAEDTFTDPEGDLEELLTQRGNS